MAGDATGHAGRGGVQRQTGVQVGICSVIMLINQGREGSVFQCIHTHTHTRARARALCSSGLARGGNSLGAWKTQGKKLLGPVTAASRPIPPRGHTWVIPGFFTLQKPWQLPSVQGEDGGVSPLDPALSFDSDQRPTTLVLLPTVSDPASPRYLTTTGKRISLCGILKNDADELLKKTETDSDFECKLTVTKGGKGE